MFVGLIFNHAATEQPVDVVFCMDTFKDLESDISLRIVFFIAEGCDLFPLFLHLMVGFLGIIMRWVQRAYGTRLEKRDFDS